MLELLHMLTEVGAAASWVGMIIAAVVVIIVLYLGIALYAVLHASGEEQQKIRYKVFRDLLKVFVRGWRR
jgi:hypothetical protein